ncbi:MAG: hypothetical protein ACOY9J_08635 [Pseudomonadota bacterium]
MSDYQNKVDDARAIGAAVFEVMDKLRAENDELLSQLEVAADVIDSLRAALKAQPVAVAAVPEGQFKPTGNVELDSVLGRPDPEFAAFRDELPTNYLARYDLSAVRLGWHFGRQAHLRISSDVAEVISSVIDNIGELTGGFAEKEDADAVSEELDRLLALLSANTGKPASPVSPREPDGYAYEYHDGSIRFTEGRPWNGCQPIRAIPYFFGESPQPATGKPAAEPKADDARDATLSKEWYAKQSHAESKCDADVGAGLAALSDEMLDAIRFRWITEDHSDAATRDACRRIIEQLPTRSLSGARIDIDAAMLAAQSASAGEKK